MTVVVNRLKPAIDILNRVAAWLLLAAIVWLCWTAARLLWLLLAPPLPPALPAMPLQNNSAQMVDRSGLFAIFADAAPAAAATTPPPNVVLKGVMLAVPESLSSALLDVNGEVKNYRVGDPLKDSGYTLVAVDWNEAVIADAADKQTVISMADAMVLDQRGVVGNQVANQRLPNTANDLGMMNNTPALPTQALPSGSTDNDNNGTPADTSPASAIEEAVTALQDNPASYLSRMGVMASGEGYQVTAAMPSGLRSRLGLESGDRVLSVNGQNVGSNPTQDASLLQQVQQSGEAQIEVQRGDQVITIRQQF